MALLRSKIEAHPLRVPGLHRFFSAEPPPHAESVRRLAGEFRRLTDLRMAEADRLAQETEDVAGAVAEVALMTTPVTGRDKPKPDALLWLFPNMAALGACTGHFSRQLPGYVAGRVAPAIDVLRFEDKMRCQQTVRSFDEAPIYGAVGDWTYDAAFYCAVTGRPVEMLIPAMHAVLRSELVGAFGPTVDVRHLQGRAV